MKLKCGEFLDTKVDYGDMDWGDMMIGMHSAYRHAHMDNNKTVGYEYYYTFDGRTYIVNNPTVFEKMVAFASKKPGHRIAGYRDRCTYVETTDDLKAIIRAKNLEKENEKGGM
ncbi:MAG: hypothetical protein J6V40_03385 [Clostridia bacterium]|nr:hypothetical protein [Clostridia bacterium]